MPWIDPSQPKPQAWSLTAVPTMPAAASPCWRIIWRARRGIAFAAGFLYHSVVEGLTAFYVRALLWAITAAMINVIIIAVMLAWFYAVVIEGGHYPTFYQAYTLRSLYWCATLTGIPTLFLTCYLIARQRRDMAIQGAWFAAIPFMVTELYLLILLTGGTMGTAEDSARAVIFISTRVIASLGAGVLAKRRARF